MSNQEINIGLLITKYNQLLDLLQNCRHLITDELIKKYQDVFDDEGFINGKVHILFVFDLIDDLLDILKRCQEEETKQPDSEGEETKEPSKNKKNITQIGWNPNGKIYNSELERKYSTTLKNSYEKLNRVIRGEENILELTELIALLNFVKFYNSSFWKLELDKIIREYKIMGRTRKQRRESLKNIIYLKIFGKSKVTNKEELSTSNNYYFNKNRINRFNVVSKVHLIKAREIGFNNEANSVISRVENIKYYLKYLVYKNKYLKLKNKL